MAEYVLYVGGEMVLPAEAGGERLCLDSLSRTYDGPAELAFTVQGTWRPTWPADTVVRLLCDEECVFHGLLGLPRPMLMPGQVPGIQYVARDYAHVLGKRALVTTGGQYSLAIREGTLQSVIDALLPHITATLAEVGVSESVQFDDGAGAMQCQGVNFTNVMIDEALRQIAADTPGVRLLMQPPGEGEENNGGYHFQAIFAGETQTIAIDETRIAELTIRQSLDKCAGAVRTLPRTTRAEATAYAEAVMTPAWNQELESSWTIALKSERDAQGVPTEASLVYRRWGFGDVGGEVDTNEWPMAAVISVFGDDAYRHIAEVESVDWSAKTVTLREPAVQSSLRWGTPRRKNLLIPGKAAKAECHLLYNLKGQLPINVKSVRFPPVGFGGKAYQLAPVTCANEVLVDMAAGLEAEAFAQQTHAVLSEPITQGEVPIVGDVPAALWNLGCRINLATRTHGTTGYEDLRAPVQGLRVEFAAGGKATVELSRDRTELLKSGKH